MLGLPGAHFNCDPDPRAGGQVESSRCLARHNPSLTPFPPASLTARSPRFRTRQCISAAWPTVAVTSRREELSKYGWEYGVSQ